MQTNTVITVESFKEDVTQIAGKDDKGNDMFFVLLSGGKVARVKTGTGKDVEVATLVAGKDQKKYMSALMASVTEVDGNALVVEDFATLSMKDYMRIQGAFTELNF